MMIYFWRSTLLIYLLMPSIFGSLTYFQTLASQEEDMIKIEQSLRTLQEDVFPTYKKLLKTINEKQEFQDLKNSIFEAVKRKNNLVNRLLSALKKSRLDANLWGTKEKTPSQDLFEIEAVEILFYLRLIQTVHKSCQDVLVLISNPHLNYSE